MLNIGVQFFTINLTAVRDLLVCEFEGMTIDHIWAIIFENFEKLALVLGISVLRKLTKSHKIFAINTVIFLVGQSECSDIKAGFSCLYTASKSWLLLINGDQIDTSVGVFPEAAKCAFHITTAHAIST